MRCLVCRPRFGCCPLPFGLRSLFGGVSWSLASLSRQCRLVCRVRVLPLPLLLRLVVGRGVLLFSLVVFRWVRRVGGFVSRLSGLRVGLRLGSRIGRVGSFRLLSFCRVAVSARLRPLVSLRRVSALVVRHPFSIGTSSGGWVGFGSPALSLAGLYGLSSCVSSEECVLLDAAGVGSVGAVLCRAYPFFSGGFACGLFWFAFSCWFWLFVVRWVWFSASSFSSCASASLSGACVASP